MARTPHPTDPSEYRAWLLRLESDWEAGLVPDPQGVAIIVTNARGEVLLQLRDDDPRIVFSNSWTLPGGVVEDGESPAQAARRELTEETGLELPLKEWKRYKRKADLYTFTVEQFIYLGTTTVECQDMSVGEGQALKWFRHAELHSLPIAFDFGEVLKEFFSSFQFGDPHP